MKKFLKIAGIAIVAIIVLAMFIPSDDTASDPTPASNPTAGKTAPPPAPKYISYEAELKNGHFEAGIDFPAGTYDIEAVEGGGNVISDNIYSGGINAIMGTEKADQGLDMYEQKYSNIKLPEGTILSITDVKVKITSDEKASADPLKERTAYPDEKVTLSNGNFEAGVDFPEGTYNIVAVKGGGNVTSDNIFDGGINAIIGTKAADQGLNMYQQEYYNIIFEEGITLSIDGVTIDLIPVRIEE